jgi:hypothetical protein
MLHNPRAASRLLLIALGMFAAQGCSKDKSGTPPASPAAAASPANKAHADEDLSVIS